MAGRRQLTRQDWTEAACAALGSTGVTGIAVEPLAAQIGATKGSFYWHFRNRGELVEAALQRWEQDETDRVIEGLAALANPVGRLRRLLEVIFLVHGETPDPTIALTSDAGNPLVASALARVTTRRVAYVREQLVEAGVEPAEAGRRALIAYTCYIGYSQLVRSAQNDLPRGEDARPFVESLLAGLLVDHGMSGSRKGLGRDERFAPPGRPP